MKIKKIRIQECGPLAAQELELMPGINLLCGEQQKRKAIAEFLDLMLFGKILQEERRAGRGKKPLAAAQTTPTVRGVLWFEKDGESFRLTRRFAETKSYHELMSETTGAITDARQGSLARVLQPVGETLYESNVTIRPMHSVTERDLAREIQNSLAGYERAGDSSLDLGRAVQMLKMSRKGYQTQAQRRFRELTAAQAEVHSDASALRQEIQKIHEQRKAMEQEARQHVHQSQEFGKDAELKRSQQITQSVAILGSTLALGCLALMILGYREPWQLGLEIVGILVGLAAGILITRAYHAELERRKNILLRQRMAEQDKEEEERSRRKQTERDHREMAIRFRNLKSELMEYEEAKKEVTPEAAEVYAINLAMETIEELSRRIAIQLNPDLEHRLNAILKEVTGGQCRGLHMDDEQHVAVRTAERTVPLEKLDRPMLELVYFALRMAAGEMLTGKDPFFVLLTDLFDSYSEESLTAVFRWMQKSPRQYLICCEGVREEELLRRAEIVYQKYAL